jgi:hypothetical protein
MASVQIGLVHRPICMSSNLLWLSLDCSPEVGHEAVEIIDRLDLAGSTWAPKQYRQGSREWLNVVWYRWAESSPHLSRHTALASKPGERCF